MVPSKAACWPAGGYANVIRGTPVASTLFHRHTLTLPTPRPGQGNIIPDLLITE